MGYKNNLCFIYLGIQIICVNIATLSNQSGWTHYFGSELYNVISFMTSVPSILIAFFIPKIIRRLGIKRIFYINNVVQIICAIGLALTGLVNGQGTGEFSGTVRSYIAFVYVILLTLTFAACFSITQTAIFELALNYGPQQMQFFIAGLSMPNLLLSIFFLWVNTLEDYGKKQIFFYLLPFLMNLISCFAFRHLWKSDQTQAEEQEAIEEDEDLLSVYGQVLRKKWLYFALTFFLFFETFLLYPPMLFKMPFSDPSFKQWNILLMFIFGVSEVSSRFINAFELECMKNLITEKNILWICLTRYVVCILPAICYMSTIGHFYMNPVLRDVLVAISYSLLAFSLGMIGNTLPAFSNSGFTKPIYFRTVGMFFSFSIIVAIFLGTLISIWTIK